jgi:hypothetical protein
MKNKNPLKMVVVRFIFMIAITSNTLSASYAIPPTPDIKVNGSDGPVSITSNDSISLSVALNTGDNSGENADWWLVRNSSSGVYSYDALKGSWVPGLTIGYQGPIFDFPLVELLSISDLTTEDSTFYFGVDMNMNSVLDINQLYYDEVNVNVASTTQKVQLEDFRYLGAFRLPGGDIRPETFAYGGNAMTFNPNGDPSGANDGFPGSLFVTGHDRLAYGELPNGSQVSEINIPVPVISKNLDELNQAEFLQGFHDVAQGLFDPLAEIVRIGMQYLSTPATGAKIHLAWGQHFQEDPQEQIASHAWIDPDLSAPNPQGTWYIGNQSLYSVNGYMFEIPASWADVHATGRYLATGRFRDGGWSGQGPALFAYRPWIDDIGTPASSGTYLEETVLLLYRNSVNTDNVVERTLKGYQHPDEWEGGAWITTTTGKSAVLFAGTKGVGAKYWYGWINPAGPEYPCIESAFIGQFVLCRLADGTPCPSEDLTGCENHSEYRGWWSSMFNAQFVLYDPADLAQVVTGKTEPWEPQPYASLDIDDYLLLNPAGIEEDMLGTGVQRRYRIGAVAYDRSNDFLYVLELFADDAKPIVHVWMVR